MKKLLYIIATAALLAACSQYYDSIEAGDAQQLGTLTLRVADRTTRADAESRIEITQIIPDWKAPDWNKYLTVLVACEERSVALDGSDSYKLYDGSVDDFNAISAAAPSFVPALYTVKLASPAIDPETGARSAVAYTDPATGSEVSVGEAAYLDTELIPAAEEGIAKPYFEGKVTGVEVRKRATAEAEVAVVIANAAVCFEFTEAFQSYFPEAELKLVTASGFEAEFGYSPEKPHQNICYWINPRGFTITGSVKRQVPAPGIIEAPATELSPLRVADGEVAPRMLYTYRFDISTAGSTENNADGYDGIGIVLVQTPNGTITIGQDDEHPDFELNPDA